MTRPIFIKLTDSATHRPILINANDIVACFPAVTSNYDNDAHEIVHVETGITVVQMKHGCQKCYYVSDSVDDIRTKIETVYKYFCSDTNCIS